MRNNNKVSCEDTNDKVLNTITYTGHEKDYETNLTYMLARYYSQGYGRFLSPDPGYDYDQLDPMSWNLYSYVRGNPVKHIDKTGKFTDISMHAAVYQDDMDAIMHKTENSPKPELSPEAQRVEMVFKIITGVAILAPIAALAGLASAEIGVTAVIETAFAKLDEFFVAKTGIKISPRLIKYFKTAPLLAATDYISEGSIKQDQFSLFISNMISPGSSTVYTIISGIVSVVTAINNGEDVDIAVTKSTLSSINLLVHGPNKLPEIVEAFLFHSEVIILNYVEKKEKEKREQEKKKKCGGKNKIDFIEEGGCF